MSIDTNDMYCMNPMNVLPKYYHGMIGVESESNRITKPDIFSDLFLH